MAHPQAVPQRDESACLGPKTVPCFNKSRRLETGKVP